MDASVYTSEISKCVRCGSCKAYCPTYNEGLTEAMSARGRISLLRGMSEKTIEPSLRLSEGIYSCILCGSCETLCPSNIDITGLMYCGRGLLAKDDRRRRLLREIVRFFVKRPMLGFRAAKILQRVWSPFGVTIPPFSFKERQQVYRPEKKIGRVAVFAGCSVNYLYPHLGVSMINVLTQLGYEVILPAGEACCGEPLMGLGLEEDAVMLARKNYELFSKPNTEAVLSLCPTCIVTLNKHYAKLIGKGLDVQDISVFLAEKLKSYPLKPLGNSLPVTYHDPCHHRYSLNITNEPRELIRSIGLELREAAEEGCCGFGGIFSLKYKEMSQELLKKRVEVYNNTGADTVITSCPGCMMYLGSGMKGRNVFHIIELMEQAVCP